MWAVVCILACVCALFGMYLYREEAAHNREEMRNLDDAILAKEKEILKALREHPGDFDLHAALKRDLRRLREQRQG